MSVPAVDGSGRGGWHSEQGRQLESQRQGSDLRKKGSHGGPNSFKTEEGKQSVAGS